MIRERAKWSKSFLSAKRNVDLDAGIVHVRQRAGNWANIGSTKSKAGKRDIPLAPIVINTLRQWQQVCPKGELGLENKEADRSAMEKIEAAITAA